MALTMKTVGRICMWLSVVVAVFYVNNALYVYGTVSKCVSPFVGSNDHTLKMWYDLGKCPDDYTRYRDVWYESTGVSYTVLEIFSVISSLWVALPVFFGSVDQSQMVATIWYIGTFCATVSTFFIHMAIASSTNSDCDMPFNTSCTSIGIRNSAHSFDLDYFNLECQAGVLDLVAPMFHQNEYNSWNMYDGCESGKFLFTPYSEEFPSEFCDLHSSDFFETGWFMVKKGNYFATGARKVISAQSIFGLVSVILLLGSVASYICMVWSAMSANSPGKNTEKSTVTFWLSIFNNFLNAGIMVILAVVYIMQRDSIADHCHGAQTTYLPLTQYSTPNSERIQNLLPIFASVPVLAVLGYVYQIGSTMFTNGEQTMWLNLGLGFTSFLAYLPFVIVLALNGGNICDAPIPYEFTNSILSLMFVSSAASIGAFEINLSAQSNFAYYGLF